MNLQNDKTIENNAKKSNSNNISEKISMPIKTVYDKKRTKNKASSKKGVDKTKVTQNKTKEIFFCSPALLKTNTTHPGYSLEHKMENLFRGDIVV